ncbi:MAG: manganese efflux pump MntP family protein [Spirochaetota bacterium]|jgi:putative Mn2+ efflux pump MntP|nr:manganese efflux pump MntP family protein [Spirochaetota bacterium]
MSFIELFLVAVGLSMDAFAVSVSAGLALSRQFLKNALIIGLYFGAFQAMMPLLGYFAAAYFADAIVAYDHWIAFILLSFLGGKMIRESFRKEEAPDATDMDCGKITQEFIAKPSIMLPLAVATSIDALAVGTSFAFLRVTILPAVIFIGVTTFLLSILGVKIGQIFGIRYKAKAVLAGGVILVLIGLKILLEHLEAGNGV